MTNINITGNDALLMNDLDNFPGINWCKAVVDDIRESVRNWNKKDITTKSISGCVAFMLARSTAAMSS